MFKLYNKICKFESDYVRDLFCILAYTDLALRSLMHTHMTMILINMMAMMQHITMIIISLVFVLLLLSFAEAAVENET